MENDIEGRSVSQEYDKSDKKKAMKEIQTCNRDNLNRNFDKQNNLKMNLSF